MNSRPHRCAPPCGARKTLRAHAFARVFRPLRKKRPAFFCHRQRQDAFPEPCCAWFGPMRPGESVDPRKKDAARTRRTASFWSEWRDLNSRPHGPEPCALPSALHPEKPVHYNDCETKCQEKFAERRGFRFVARQSFSALRVLPVLRRPPF